MTLIMYSVKRIRERRAPEHLSFPNDFAGIAANCADRRNAWQFRLHLELIDFGDFGSEREDDFSQFCGKSQAAQRPVTF